MKKVQLENGENIWVFESTIDENPIVVFVSDDEPDGRALLDRFARQLPHTWNDLYLAMESGFAECGHSDEFPPEEFFLNIARTDPKEFMGDKSSFLVRFEFEIDEEGGELPIYDFFLDDDFKIVHHQPVFE